MREIVICLFILFLAGCSNNKKENETLYNGKILPLHYAEGFSILELENAKWIEVKYPYQGATQGHQYLLVKKNAPVPSGFAKATVIRIPIERIVCTSTTHIPMLDYLGESQSLVGFPTLDYISSTTMRLRIDHHEIQELGIDKGMDIEQLAALKPDLVMGYSISGNYGQFNKIESLGIPVVMNAEYLERSPLGRAEWLKFVAAFYDKTDLADSIFNTIEKEYLSVSNLVKNTTSRPSVLSGVMYGDGWFLPGGQNYAATLFKEAGMSYLWQSDSSHGFLQLSLESVFDRAHDADYWIGVASFESLQEMKNAESRYAQFSPFINKKVYTYNQRKGAKGGNEFLELGYLRPDLILKDLVKIAHPEVLPNYKLYFHRQLE